MKRGESLLVSPAFRAANDMYAEGVAKLEYNQPENNSAGYNHKYGSQDKPTFNSRQNPSDDDNPLADYNVEN
ncbi:hypothetical protein MRX96_001483 [Rhipicephalus microplus]